MITTPEDYMRRLSYIQLHSGGTEYVLFPEDEPRFIIDANTREISIPPEFSFLGVRGDHNAETIYFEIDRYFDGHDLSQETCVVQFESFDRNQLHVGEGFFAVTQLDVSTAPGKIIFGWSIRNNVTAQAGSIKFSVRFYSIDTSTSISTFFLYSFNTLPATLPVLESLNTIEDMKPLEPSEVEQLTIMFSNIRESAIASANEAKISSSSAATFAAQAMEAKKFIEGHAGDFYNTHILTLKTSEWTLDQGNSTEFPYHIDVSCEASNPDLTPIGTVVIEDFEAAQLAGVANTCETYNKYVRFYSNSIPTKNISAIVMLFGKKEAAQ